MSEVVIAQSEHNGNSNKEGEDNNITQSAEQRRGGAAAVNESIVEEEKSRDESQNTLVTLNPAPPPVVSTQVMNDEHNEIISETSQPTLNILEERNQTVKQNPLKEELTTDSPRDDLNETSSISQEHHNNMNVTQQSGNVISSSADSDVQVMITPVQDKNSSPDEQSSNQPPDESASPTPTTIIPTEEINDNDVLCGRGAGTNKHIGNVRFRQIVQANQQIYIHAKVVDKVSISSTIVEAIRAKNPPGRFLKKVEDSPSCNSWMEIPKQQAREKTSQALREKPDRKSSMVMDRSKPLVMKPYMPDMNLTDEMKYATAEAMKVFDGCMSDQRNLTHNGQQKVYLPSMLPPTQPTMTHAPDPMNNSATMSNSQTQQPSAESSVKSQESVTDVVSNLTNAVQAMSQVATKLQNVMQAANMAFPPFVQTPNPVSSHHHPAPPPEVRQQQQHHTPTPQKPKPAPAKRSRSATMAAIHLNPNTPPIQKHEITDNDVLFGRGGVTNNHLGNRRYRELVREYQQTYLIAPKTEKAQIARKIVDIIRNHRDPPGRFLVKGEVGGTWVDVGDERSREKTSQALREKAPEMRRVLTAAAGLVGVNKTSAELQQKGSNPSNLVDPLKHQPQQQHVLARDGANTIPNIPLPPPPLPVTSYDRNHAMQRQQQQAMYAGAPKMMYATHAMHHQTNSAMQQQQQQQQQPHAQPGFYQMNNTPPQSNLYRPSFPQQHVGQVPAAQQQQQMSNSALPPAPALYSKQKHQPQHPPCRQQMNQPPVPSVSAQESATSTTPPTPSPQGQGSTSSIKGDQNIQIGENDVLYGRGAGINCHIGNQRFRSLVKYHQKSYLEAPKLLKGDIARSIVASIRSANPPGRFLSQDSATAKWVEVDDNKAYEKTSQALREKAPEIRKGLAITITHQQQHQLVQGGHKLPLIPQTTSMKQDNHQRTGEAYPINQFQHQIPQDIRKGLAVAISHQQHHQFGQYGMNHPANPHAESDQTIYQNIPHQVGMTHNQVNVKTEDYAQPVPQPIHNQIHHQRQSQQSAYTQGYQQSDVHQPQPNHQEQSNAAPQSTEQNGEGQNEHSSSNGQVVDTSTLPITAPVIPENNGTPTSIHPTPTQMQSNPPGISLEQNSGFRSYERTDHGILKRATESDNIEGNKRLRISSEISNSVDVKVGSNVSDQNKTHSIEKLEVERDTNATAGINGLTSAEANASENNNFTNICDQNSRLV